jgi:hypothetical protein
MKTFFLPLVLLLIAPAASHAQDVASNLSPTIEHFDTVGSLASDEPAESQSAFAVAALSEDRRPNLASTSGAHPEAAAARASASLNGVNLQVQTLPASGTVLISFDMPQLQGYGTLELADATTGALIFSGSVLVTGGQVELPVSDVRNLFEVRLSTDHDFVIARMAR